MRTALAILLVIGLFSSPLGCFTSCPRHVHECGSDSSAATVCPYDILAAAKAALPVIAAIAPLPVVRKLAAIPAPVISTRVANRRGLHLLDCVLRV